MCYQNDSAKAIAELVKAKTLSEKRMKVLTMFGFTIEAIPEKLDF